MLILLDVTTVLPAVSIISVVAVDVVAVLMDVVTVIISDTAAEYAVSPEARALKYCRRYP